MTVKEQLLNLFDYLSEPDQLLILEIAKRFALAWDPDFTKLTPSERTRLEEAERDPERISHEDINWD